MNNFHAAQHIEKSLAWPTNRAIKRSQDDGASAIFYLFRILIKKTC